MNRYLFVAGILLALVTGLLARPALPSSMVAAAPAASSATVAPAAGIGGGSIHTSGSAVIRVQPDRASVRFGIQTFAATPRASQSENATITRRVLQAIESQGIEAKDIATDYFSVRPEYEYPVRGKRSLLGYWSENAIQVTLRDVEKLSSILVAALDAGATSVDDLSFSTTRLRELRDEARALAVKAAMEKAEAIALAANITSGPVTDIQENSWSYYYGMWSNRSQWMNQAQNVVQEASSVSAPETEDGEFSLGQIVVQAQVTLTAAIR